MHTHDGTLFNHEKTEKEWNFAICDITEGPWGK